MSYTVLARKWRPRRFAEMVGQQHVVKALVNSLAAERLHHAYLFAGTRGVGKTTLARILAKALNCAEGVVAEPCGRCDACGAIDEGRFVDLIEVDAASRTKVDDTRELMENTQYAPSHGRFKVYLIDEVHMLSNHSFNALLKTLEEPPPHIKFLLATTDPQKLPVTVLSRCLQFNLKRLTVAEICERLEEIHEAEAFTAEADGLKALARAADGSMRDGLSLLDQAIAFAAADVTADAVSSMLGSIDRQHVIRFAQALAARDGSALLNEVADLDQQAPDYGAVLDELMGVLQRIAVLQLVGADETEDQVRELPELAAAMSPEDVQLYYQIAVQGRRDLAVCRDYRSAFEMTLLRMLAFRPQVEGKSRPRPAHKPQPEAAPRPSRKADRGPRPGTAPRHSPTADQAPRPSRTATQASRTEAASPRSRRGDRASRPEATSRPSHAVADKRTPAKRVAAGAPPDSEAARGGADSEAARARHDLSGRPAPVSSAMSSVPPESSGGRNRAPRRADARTGPDPEATQGAPDPEAARARPDSGAARAVPDPDRWHEFIDTAGLAGAPRQLAEHCAMKPGSGDALVLLLDPESAHLNTERVRKRLLEQLQQRLPEGATVIVEVGDPPGATPAEIRVEGESERMRKVRASVESDPVVKGIQAEFDAVLELESIRPLEGGQGRER